MNIKAITEQSGQGVKLSYSNSTRDGLVQYTNEDSETIFENVSAGFKFEPATSEDRLVSIENVII